MTKAYRVQNVIDDVKRQFAIYPLEGGTFNIRLETYTPNEEPLITELNISDAAFHLLIDMLAVCKYGMIIENGKAK